MHRPSLSKPFVALLVALSIAAGCSSDDEPLEAAAAAAEATPTEAPTATAEPEGEKLASPAPDVGSLTAADFVVAHHCNYGFFVTNEAETAGLVVTFEDLTAAQTGNVPAVGNVPSIIWSGELRLGTDLADGWCTDEIGAAAVAERFEIETASIAISGEPPIGTEAPLSAVLSDILIAGGDGTLITLATVNMSNDRWGYLPG